MHRHVATTAMLHVVTTGQDHHRVVITDRVHRHRAATIAEVHVATTDQDHLRHTVATIVERHHADIEDNLNQHIGIFTIPMCFKKYNS